MTRAFGIGVCCMLCLVCCVLYAVCLFTLIHSLVQQSCILSLVATLMLYDILYLGATLVQQSCILSLVATLMLYVSWCYTRTCYTHSTLLYRVSWRYTHTQLPATSRAHKPWGRHALSFRTGSRALTTHHDQVALLEQWCSRAVV
jgi:hypothetical protein